MLLKTSSFICVYLFLEKIVEFVTKNLNSLNDSKLNNTILEYCNAFQTLMETLYNQEFLYTVSNKLVEYLIMTNLQNSTTAEIGLYVEYLNQKILDIKYITNNSSWQFLYF